MNKQQTEIKEYLSQAFRIDQRIQSKMEQVASLNDLAHTGNRDLFGYARK